MNISLAFIRFFFVMICVLFLTTYSVNTLAGGLTIFNVLIGLLAGLAFGGALIAADTFFKRFNLRSFNIAALGLFFGYLMGQVLWIVFNTLINVSPIELSPYTRLLIQMSIFLFASYFGMVMTARAAEELYISIPFIKFKPTSYKKKDIILDCSILTDSRIIDLASSGLLDHHLLIPRFISKELYALLESSDESTKFKSRRSLDVLKKLEAIPNLDLRYSDTDFPEVKDTTSKLIRLARLLEANIITADINRIQYSSIEGTRVINIHTLSNALKPITQSGEYINIKIQRYGKDAKQGIGYLDDGTMVVVNGGAEYFEKVIKGQVISVKHTPSGRMIFCNATEESFMADQEFAKI